MLRSIALLAAVALASPAAAGTYTGKPVAPVADQRIIGRDIIWNCGPDACQGSTDESRPLVLCQSLAKKAGRLSSFIANGRAFAGQDLDKCNSVAPNGPSTSLAEAE
jgi:hypothetical protein